MSKCLHKTINVLTFKLLFRTHLLYSLPFRDLYISFFLTRMYFQQRCIYGSAKFPQQNLDTSLPLWRITFTASRFPLESSHFFFQSGNVSLSYFASLVYLFILGLSRTTLPSIQRCKVALSHMYFSLTHTRMQKDCHLPHILLLGTALVGKRDIYKPSRTFQDICRW